jgi:hypothetical protein
MIDATAIKKGAVTPLDPGKGLPNDPKSRVGHIRELFDLSAKYMHDNYWDELADVYRAVRCRTKPIMVRGKDGNQIEDKNRTNVCMPELNLIVRRKTARLTANPPTLDYYVPGGDPELLADRLTARAYYEYDKSGEAWEFRRSVQQANTFGFTYFKTYYDSVDIQRQIRYLRDKQRDRRIVMAAEDADPEQIEQAVASLGDVLTDQEVAAAVAKRGNELRTQQITSIYEGPVTKTRFIGDILLEPGCLTLNDSSFVIEEYRETALWLTKMLEKTYTDPESGISVPVFDEDAVADLVDQDVENRSDKHEELKRLLRDAIQMNHPNVANRLMPQKKFRVTEFHAPDKDGRLWIEYIGNDSVYLGKQPYPFDFYGKWVYTEYIPWPDLIGAIGDSSPRLLRFLHAMHNAAVGQRNDLIQNILRRTYMVSGEADIPDEAVERKFGRFLQVNDIAGIKQFQETDVPSSAWQTEAQIKSEMQQAEPTLGGVESGTEFNPQAGKTATTAILAAKSGDALTQFELDGLNLCLKELGEKKLEIHRQIADKPIPVPNRPHYVKSEALTQKFGKTSLITIDPYEIQDPLISVEPVAGSTLAVDDELRAGKIQTIYQMAEADPILWNKFAAAKLVLTTIKGVGDTSKLLNNPNPPAPAGPKISANITIAFDKLQPDTQNDILQYIGLPPSDDATAKGQLDAVIHTSRAADAAANLSSAANPGNTASNGTDNGAGILKAQMDKVNNKINAAP